MKSSRPPANSFPQALKKTRIALRVSQEAFSVVSSRTYISSLERGLQSPTLNKVDALAEQIAIHPLTLLALSYLNSDKKRDADQLLESLRSELHMILERSQPTGDKKMGF
jgi:transcriptional regulator with XRE-family HTH domain